MGRTAVTSIVTDRCTAGARAPSSSDSREKLGIETQRMAVPSTPGAQLEMLNASR